MNYPVVNARSPPTDSHPSLVPSLSLLPLYYSVSSADNEYYLCSVVIICFCPSIGYYADIDFGSLRTQQYRCLGQFDITYLGRILIEYVEYDGKPI